jgi:hypothetical protein
MKKKQSKTSSKIGDDLVGIMHSKTGTHSSDGFCDRQAVFVRGKYIYPFLPNLSYCVCIFLQNE